MHNLYSFSNLHNQKPKCFNARVRPGFFLTVALTCFLSISCTVNKPEHLNLKTIEDSATELAEQSLLTTQTIRTTSQLNSDWWQTFGNDELNDLITTAFDQNNNLLQAEARTRAAQANLANARSGLFPSISASVGRNKTTINGGSLSAQANNASGYTTSGQLSTSYEIDLWSRIRESAKASQSTFKASTYDFQAAKLSIAAQLSTTWSQWIAAKKINQLLKQELTDQQTNLKLVENRFKTGRAEASDVFQQKQLIENTRSNIATNTTNISVFANAISVLTGQPIGRLNLQTEQLPAINALTNNGVRWQAVLLRPDVQSAWWRVKAANNQQAAAIANQFPQLNFSLSYSDQTRDSSQLFENFSRNLSLALAGPIFDGGARAAEVDRQTANMEEQVSRYKQIVLTSLEEVSNALTQENNQFKILEHIQQQLTLANLSLKRILAGYRNGTSSYLAVLNAQQAVSELKRRVISEEQRLFSFRVSLLKATSSEVEKEEVR